MDIEIFFVNPSQPFHIGKLSVPENCTVSQALTYAQQQYPQILGPQTLHQMGIFGKRCKPDTILQSFDRIEVYAPLLIDPKIARKLTAKAQRKQSAKG